MNKNILMNVFENVSSEIYCVNKIIDVNNFLDSKEINIFCDNFKSFSKKILTVLNNFIKYGIEVRINFVNNMYWYIEILKDNKNEIIFNLYSSFKRYKNIIIKKGLFACILSDRVEKKIYLNEILTKIYFTRDIDNLIIKYLDYFELNNKKLDNDIYIDSIIKKLVNESDRRSFLYRLNRYISFTKDHSQNKFYELIFFFRKKIKLIYKDWYESKKTNKK